MSDDNVLPFKKKKEELDHEDDDAFHDEYDVFGFDYEAYFDKGEELNDEFYLRRLGYFCHEVFAGRTPPKWLLENIANRLYWVLIGDDWTNRFPLPWTTPEFDGGLSRAGNRAMRLYAAIKNELKKNPESTLDSLLRWQCDVESVSYPTVRADYYDVCNWVEKKGEIPARFLKKDD